jgi:dynein heavy chain
METVEQDPTTLPDEGIYIQGLWFEAAKWDTERKELVELDDGMLVSPAPIMHLVPVEKAAVPISGVYQCPIFMLLHSDREIDARGPLVRTVMTLPIPTAKSADFWVLRGASLLLSVDG